ncbi:beta-propeller repeat protein [Leptospira wolbachii serovar Codice str. CDC]|uniref:Beta-propeller repeat protein n=1 Tax=Leptospira wolbachii serovar Codice str. CDC TaxID=1218599 RepID=R9A6V6_9LEPT|nr:SBBP repeat-containing protein [Leptospira wolbachii]EOQ95990.1 beta-propeller repeat protein [Leptospira wolbachii serovar Codice str. CDC]
MQMRFWLLPMVLITLQCKAVPFNNPSDSQSKDFWKTQFLRCFSEDWECWEIPQDNQGVKEWTRLLGAGGVNTFSSSTATERNGNIYSVGTTSGSLAGQMKISSGSLNDIFLAKYDREGNLLWLKQMGSLGVASSAPELAHIDRFGDIYIVGTSDAPFNELPASATGSLLIKLNPSGTVLWTRIIPSGVDFLGYGVTTDADGSAFITGNTEETYLNGDVAGGNRNIFVIKYNRNGDFGWSRLIGQASFAAYGQQIQYDPYSKSILATGTVSGVGSFLGTNLPGGLTDSYLLSLDSNNGAFKWVRYLGLAGGTASTTLRALSVDKKGSVYLTGDVNADIDSQIKDGGTVQILTKFSVTGDKLWTRLLGGGGSSITNVSQVFADNASHIYTTGNTTGTLNGIARSGLQDAYLTKYDANGNLIWIRTSGSSGSTIYGRGISSDKYGTLYVSGSTDGSFDGQFKQGTTDAFLSKYK